jgi:serine protease inhibitor
MLSRRVALGLLLTGILATGGCSLVTPAEAKSSKPRRDAPALSEADDPVADLARTLNPLVFTGAGAANVAYSPMSIALALGMLRAGATGESARQLDAVFGSGARLQDRMNAAERGLVALDGDRRNSSGKKTTVTVDSACAVWAQEGVRWTQAYLDALAVTYGAGLRLSDFAGSPGAARKAINAFVADRTRDKITDLMTPESVNRMTRLVLVNALYLQMPWWKSFPDATQSPFHAPTGEVSTPSVSSTLHTTYHQADNYRTVTIPYAGKEIAMTVVLPDQGALEAVGRRLGSTTLTDVSTDRRDVQLTMPLFDLYSRVDLATVMRQAGVTAVFDARGEFRPMSDDPAVDLFVSEMLHRATVTIDEQGTEAAAATAVVSETTSAPADPPVAMVVDRPFYFVIHDTRVGMPLFVGRVMDPTKP